MEQTRMGAPVTHEAPSEAELEQLINLFQSSVAGNLFRMDRRARSAGQLMFELGWLVGVRNGNTGLALMGVPLPASMAEDACEALARHTRQDPRRPVVEQAVRYHGSLIGAHGRYWITGISVPSGERERRYELSEWSGTRYRLMVSNVRRTSFTALDDYRGEGRPSS
ncbi:hypothetical protein ACFQ7N_40525 [Streptomyces niveus]|uniref:hypothetical protein n=1 Tax=Streptomyces niveus TaxID=193462 RepID=UPI0036C7AC22